MKLLLIYTAVFLAVQLVDAQQPALNGRVLTMTGNPIVGATVNITGYSQKALTDSLGYYDFTKPVTSLTGNSTYRMEFTPRDNRLSLTLDRPDRLTIGLYSLSGRQIRRISDGILPIGIYTFDLAEIRNGSGMFLIKVDQNGKVGWQKLAVTRGLASLSGVAGDSPDTHPLSKTSATTLIWVSHSKYHGGLARVHERNVSLLTGTQNFRMFSTDAGWDVCAPTFSYKFDQSPGALYYQKLLESPQTYNQEILREVCQSIWNNPSDVPTKNRFTNYTANINTTVTTGVASTGGPVLNFNVGYINDQKNAGDINAKYEILGVLLHEGVHSYQPYYQTEGAAGFGEAVPDAIRALTGFFRWPTGTKCTASYTDNYQDGGKYWYFIEQKHPGFLNKVYKLTAGDISVRVKQVTGENLESLVTECKTKGMPLGM